MTFDISDYMYNGDQFITSLFVLRDILVAEIGPQTEHTQGPFHISGDGWWLSATLIKSRTIWELYIQDDNLALMFKLKWL
jgi:hypothetical protein